MSTTAEPHPSSVPLDAARMQALLDGEHAEIRNRVRELMSRPEFAPGETSLPTAEYREQVMSWAKAVAASGETLLGIPEEYGGQNNVGGTVAAFETIAHGDLSLLVKFGVQFGLFGGAVLHLGTKKHHDRYLRDIFSLELPGCFAMTETGHGSNVQSRRDDRHVRRGDAGVRRPHPDRVGTQGLHRQRRASTAGWPRCSRS